MDLNLVVHVEETADLKLMVRARIHPVLSNGGVGVKLGARLEDRSIRRRSSLLNILVFFITTLQQRQLVVRMVVSFSKAAKSFRVESE